MRCSILALLSTFSVFALAASSQLQIPPYYFSITDGTTDDAAPCNQNGLVAKCARSTTWNQFTTTTHLLRCDDDTVNVSHSWDPDDGAAVDVQFSCSTKKEGRGVPTRPFNHVEMLFTVSGTLSSCSSDVPTLAAGSVSCNYYHNGALIE